MPGKKVDRLTRVNELLKRELGALIEADRMWPGNILVSVTGVSSSTDLRNATVSVSIFGGDNKMRRHILEELELHAPDWQDSLAANLGFKHTPVLCFKLDRSIEKGDRVFALLNAAEQKMEQEKK